MFLDTSAIVEVLLDAPGRQSILSRLKESPDNHAASPTVIFESTVVLSSRLKLEPGVARQLVEDFLNGIGAEILPITRNTGTAAVDAFSRFGKGRHPAKLNFGDCFSYAGAKEADMPLLYVGEDFARTDIA